LLQKGIARSARNDVIGGFAGCHCEERSDEAILPVVNYVANGVVQGFRPIENVFYATAV